MSKIKLLIGITGSIAAIKLPLLIHKLVNKHYAIKVIITKEGLRFVTETAIASMGAEVFLDNNIDCSTYNKAMQHIWLGKWADYYIICPASANTISKLSQASADNLLTASVLASNAPKIIIPAMNQSMWANNLVQDNIQKLKSCGISCWGPVTGIQACGDSALGRMLEVEQILDKIESLLTPKDNLLLNKHIVITAGGTREPIDPVRYISNYSSGKMGYALAVAAINLGSKVTLISSSYLPTPSGVQMIAVTTGKEMLDAALDIAASTDIFIGCAAVCDYKSKSYSTHKIKKSKRLTIDLIATQDILTTLRGKHPQMFIVGFAAETENTIEYAKAKLVGKNLNMIIANNVANNKVFDEDTSQVYIIDRNFNIETTDHLNKNEIATIILNKIALQYVKL